MMRSLVITTLLFSVACVAADGADDADDLAASEQAIIGGDAAPSWAVARAVKPTNPCTATLIAPRFAVTAVHCTQYNNATTNPTVHLYTDPGGFAPTLARTIVQVHYKPGTAVGDVWDDDGRFCDLAVLELDTAAPATSSPSPMAWIFPTPGAPAIGVGAGNHDGVPNTVGELRAVTTSILSATDDTGSFAVTTPVANPGDSGGALYVSSRLVGVTRSQSGYTSVPAHLDWILEASRYAWPYGTPQRRVRLGTTLSTFPESSHRVCQYACEHTACAAYNWSPLTETCTLLATVTGAYDSPFVLSEDRAIRGLSR